MEVYQYTDFFCIFFVFYKKICSINVFEKHSTWLIQLR